MLTLSLLQSRVRLFMAVSVASTLNLCAASILSAQAPKKSEVPSADEVALLNYHLTMEKLEQVDAVNKKLAVGSDQDPVLNKELSGKGILNSGNTLDDALSGFDARAPHVAAIIKAAGLTDREYVMTMYSALYASVGVQIKQMAPDKPLPPTMSAENVALVQQNQTRFTEIMKTAESLGNKRRHEKVDSD